MRASGTGSESSKNGSSVICTCTCREKEHKDESVCRVGQAEGGWVWRCK